MTYKCRQHGLTFTFQGIRVGGGLVLGMKREVTRDDDKTNLKWLEGRVGHAETLISNNDRENLMVMMLVMAGGTFRRLFLRRLTLFSKGGKMKQATYRRGPYVTNSPIANSPSPS